MQDAIYGEGNEGPVNPKKRKAAGEGDSKSAADIDFKVIFRHESVVEIHIARFSSAKCTPIP